MLNFFGGSCVTRWSGESAGDDRAERTRRGLLGAVCIAALSSCGGGEEGRTPSPAAASNPLTAIVPGTGVIGTPIDTRTAFNELPNRNTLTVYGATVGNSAAPLRTVGLRINARTGEVTGNYTGTDDEVISVTASNEAGTVSATAVVVIDVNEPPEVSSTPLEDKTARAGAWIAPIQTAPGFWDPNPTDTLTYTATVGGDRTPLSSVGLSIDSQTGVIMGRLESVGNVNVVVTVIDGGGLTATQDFTILVDTANVNQAPTTTDEAPYEEVVLTTNTSLNLPIPVRPWFTDSDGDQTLAFSLVDASAIAGTGLKFNATSAEFRGPFTGTENTAIRIRASDGTASVEHTLRIKANSPVTVTGDAPNMAVVLTSGSSLNLPIDLNSWFVDKDGDQRLKFEAVSGLTGTGLIFDSRRGIIFGPFSGVENSRLVMRASDGYTSADHSLNILANTAPTLNWNNLKSEVVLTSGMNINLPISIREWFTDTDKNQRLTVDVVSGLRGTGLIFDAVKSEIRGTFAGRSDRVVVLKAHDGHASKSHRLKIIANAAPRITNRAPTSAVTLVTNSNSNLPIYVRDWFTDADGRHTLSFSLVNHSDLNGTGLIFDSNSGMIRGTFTGTGDAIVRVSASDGHAPRIIHSFRIKPNKEPQITRKAPRSAVILSTNSSLNLPIDVTGWFTDPDRNQVLKYSLVDRSVLDGTGLIFDTNRGEIKGRFTGGSDLTVHVKASDELSSGIVHPLKITANAKPQITRSAPNEAVILTSGEDTNLPINVAEWFTDADGDQTLEFSLVNQSDLNGTGLTFNAGSGEFLGPFIGSENATIRVMASDGHAPIVHEFEIAVNEEPRWSRFKRTRP